MTSHSFNADAILHWLSRFAVYDRSRGGFVRTATTKGPQHNQKIGELIGTDDGLGYLRVFVLSKRYKIHHLVWAAEHGDWPSQELDHIDGNRSNNHISNLRQVSRAINAKNAKMKSTNTSGYPGVSYHAGEGKFSSRVTHNYKRYFCGWHSTAEEAYAARQAFIAAHPEMGYTERHG